MPVSIVIVDDNPRVLAQFANTLARLNVQIFTANTPERGLDLIYLEHPQIVLTDPGILEQIIAFDPAIDVIALSPEDSSRAAVQAIRKGATDYLVKPVSAPTLAARVSKLLENAERRIRTSAVEHEVLRTASFEGIIGRSPAFLAMSSRIVRIAPHYVTALIAGESGTGKELVARALHRLSPVASGRFVVLNCSALVETLFESELFGHVRGSFTGATHDKVGLFEHADGGTIFLDEIGDMPMSTQAKLLRTVQNREVLRVGSLTPRRVDVRVIAATNKDLRQAIKERTFREDLYYRLSMVGIEVPPLADRKDDLPLLSAYFLERFAKQFGKNVRQLTRRAQTALARHDWPGNVRELENSIGHGCMMATGELVDLPDLPPYLALPPRSREMAEVPPPDATDSGGLGDSEKRLLVRALARAKGNQTLAAQNLRIGRDALRYRIRKYGLEGPPVAAKRRSAAAGNAA